MKKIHTVLALLLITGSAFATETFSVVCSAPNISTLYRFDGEGTIEATKEADGTYTIVKSQFNFVVTPAGFNAEAFEVTNKETKNILKYIESEFTSKPFYQLSMIKNNDQAEIAWANILLDYPSKLDSSIRLKNGMTFRSKCNLQ